MRLAGEILLILAMAFVLAVCFSHRAAMSDLTVSQVADPAKLAQVMKRPSTAAILATPIAAVGVGLIIAGIVHDRRQ